MPSRVPDVDVDVAGPAQSRGHPFGGAPHVGAAIGIGADRGNRHELGELAKISALVIREHLEHGIDASDRHHSRLTLIGYAPTASSGSVRFIASDETMNRTRPSAGLDAVCKT